MSTKTPLGGGERQNTGNAGVGRNDYCFLRSFITVSANLSATTGIFLRTPRFHV